MNKDTDFFVTMDDLSVLIECVNGSREANRSPKMIPMSLALPILERNFYGLTDEYRKFATEKSECRACPVYNDYQQVGQSEGCVADPIFMIVGEALGKDEVEQVRPFIGKAGQVLREQLRRHEKTFNRKTTLISNVLACRPLDNKFPTDRSIPDGCADRWLRREIKLVKPKIIVTLGNPASEFVRGESGITRIRGSWKRLDQYDAWCFSTYHPSYVMRSASDPMIQKLWVGDWDRLADGWKERV